MRTMADYLRGLKAGDRVVFRNQKEATVLGAYEIPPLGLIAIEFSTSVDGEFYNGRGGLYTLAGTKSNDINSPWNIER